MNSTNANLAPGILPDAVIRDRNANAYLLAVVLQPELDAPGVQGWLGQLSALLNTLQQPDDQGIRLASAAVAFSGSFFVANGQPRFGLTANQVPAGLASPPALAALNGIPPAGGDVFIYIMSTSEAIVATFERGLSQTRTAGLVSVTVENGYQRMDHREAFGFLDGLRNLQGMDREPIVFVDPNRNPEEPEWAAGGSYLAYMKIHQNLDAMAALPEAAQESIIGRRKSDGSRIDLPEGTPAASEGTFADDACPVTAHVRKVGPRGALHDQTRIFRRGVPYLTLNTDGTVDAGLQFVSFQRSLLDFAVIFDRWMTDANFPSPGSGPDALQGQNLTTIEKAGFFFCPPADPRYVGAQLFDPAAPDPCTVGTIAVQKQLVDTNAQPVLAELGGIAFQILNNGQPVGSQFVTDSSGRALSPLVPRNVPLVVHEVSPPAGFQQANDTPVTLTEAAQLVTVANQEIVGPGPAPVYSA